MITHISYEKSKIWARKRYYKIGNVACLALHGETITFNAIGFRHLMRKGKERSHREQKFRFSLISYAPKIVAGQNVSVTHRIQKSSTGTITQFWGLEKECEGRKLRVVVRQEGNGLKHFYSIMEHTSKNPVKDEIL